MRDPKPRIVVSLDSLECDVVRDALRQHAEEASEGVKDVCAALHDRVEDAMEKKGWL